MEKISEQFLLLALHPEKPRYVISGQKLNVGLFGSVLMDLYFEEKIDFLDKRVKLKSSKTREGSVEAFLMEKIRKSKRPPRIKNLISNNSVRGRKFRFHIFRDMQRKGILKIESKKFWIIPYKLVSLLDRKARENLIVTLKSNLEDPASIPERNAGLLGLISACKMDKVLSVNKEERKEIRRKLKELSDKNVVSTSVEKAIKELEAAIASTVAITAASSASS